MRSGNVEIAAVNLGAALVVFFAGAAATVAAGVSPPTALWAARRAISGGLLGLLVPGPEPKAVRKPATVRPRIVLTEFQRGFYEMARLIRRAGLLGGHP